MIYLFLLSYTFIKCSKFLFSFSFTFLVLLSAALHIFKFFFTLFVALSIFINRKVQKKNNLILFKVCKQSMLNLLVNYIEYIHQLFLYFGLILFDLFKFFNFYSKSLFIYLLQRHLCFIHKLSSTKMSINRSLSHIHKINKSLLQNHLQRSLFSKVEIVLSWIIAQLNYKIQAKQIKNKQYVCFVINLYH
ncbi:transmembrane protein, putative (macronuclear) [Tetrahymena thermophila SB210]|uniref:Transmembrane protein, putative n=1 Tax=Tetrahymena thermophila (strain SB210) TaxID=312017 RepID=W7XD91_TETTS|nr:transmembrane protein, putative [Tetrahymena thermophila SB210]EWS74593.1 transmembrane protein, putative [Tetrahymena thermophila SB210]|eukprot:XP_012652894.1 transmembrane protein, putative [Tetrahymena thermophila SB210]